MIPASRLTRRAIEHARRGDYWARLAPSEPGRVELPPPAWPSDAAMLDAADRAQDVPAGDRGVLIERVAAITEGARSSPSGP